MIVSEFKEFYLYIESMLQSDQIRLIYIFCANGYTVAF